MARAITPVILLSCLIMGVDSWVLTTRSSARLARRSTIMGVHTNGDGSGMTRGEMLGSSLGSLALLGGLVLSPRIAAADGGSQEYTTEEYPVKFGRIPANWERTDTFIGGISDRRPITVFRDPTGAGDANVFVVYTPIRSDFSSTSSFGNVLDVAKTIVPKGRGVESRLITAENRKGYFYYDYEVQPDGQPKRHLQTIFSVLSEEQVLVTFTAQCLDSQYSTFKPVFDGIVDSFTIVKA